MSVATSTLITVAAISAGASAGASIYGAKKQSDAAKTASAQQQQAAKEATAAQTPLYNRALDIAQQQAAQGQARLDPYAQQGGAGLTALSSFLGVPQPSGGPNPALSPYAATPSQQAAANAFVPTAVRNSPTASQVPQGPGPYATPQMLAAMGQGGGGGMVMLRAPNGQQQAVPADHAEYFVARGATRV